MFIFRLYLNISYLKKCTNSNSLFDTKLKLQAILEQFRRVANLYFLMIGGVMAVGYYTEAFESAISPWTTLGPLCMVISISLLQEGLADAGRHRSDSETNNHPCVVLSRSDDVDSDQQRKRDKTVMNGQDVKVSLEKSYFLGSSLPKGNGENAAKISFESVKRMDIRQGHIVLVRNRDMVPADLVLLASSSDNGNSYIETSSIDGETNLKLRTSPHLPKHVIQQLLKQSARSFTDDADDTVLRESLEQATKRICRLSALAFPDGINALDNPANPIDNQTEEPSIPNPASGLRLMGKMQSAAQFVGGGVSAGANAVRNRRKESREGSTQTEVKYVAALKSETPNASVNTFGGVLILPPVELGGPSVEIALNADNILLRGAVLRNTEWAIGISVYTGSDTKLVRNSFETPSKFSQLDKLMNYTVVLIVGVMIFCISYLATFAVFYNNSLFESLWYVKLVEDMI